MNINDLLATIEIMTELLEEFHTLSIKHFAMVDDERIDLFNKIQLMKQMKQRLPDVDQLKLLNFGEI